MDVSNESFFKKNDPALQHYQSFLKQFGRDEAVIAAISAPDVLAPAFLSKLEAYHKDLEASVPYLDLLTSLVNVTSIRDREGELLIDDLRNVWPSRYEDARPFRQAVLENPLYRNLVVTEDGKMTVVIIRSSAFAVEQEAKTQTSLRERIANWHDRLFANMEKNESSEDSQQPNSPSRSTSKNELDTSFLPENVAASVSDTSIQKVPPKHLSTQQLNQFMQAIREVSARHQETDFPIRLAGGPVIDAEHNHTIHQDFGTLLPLTAVMVFLILLLLLRRVSAAIIAMLPVFLCLFVTIGVMGWLGFPVNQVSVAMPPLILTVCIGDSVHILSLFYSRLQSDGDRDRAIVYALKRSGVAILFTSLTTAAGFLAFTMSDIKPIAEFGVMIAFAAMAAFIYSVVLVPAVLSCTGASIQEVKRAPRSQWVVKVLSKITEFSMVHFKEVLLTTFALIVIAAPS
ncbi:MAG: efflux RND transporter permease subunit, partial [Exilibacterium sp.]